MHEAPAVMWVPLVILAVLSVVGGWVNIPEALPLPHIEALHHWLEPVFEPARTVAASAGMEAAHSSPIGGGEAMWALLSVLAALLAIGLTLRALVSRPYRPAAESAEPVGFARVLYRKWYVDELYDRLIIRPLLALWRGCWKIVDDRLIDGTVNGLGNAARVFGWMGGQLQSGRVTTYLVIFMLGTLLVLGVLAG